MLERIGDGERANEAQTPIDGDIILIPKRWNGDVDRLGSVRLGLGFGFEEFHYPTCIHNLLRRCVWVVGQISRADLPTLICAF